MSPQSGSLELSVSLGDATFSASGDTDVVLSAFADFKEWSTKAAPPKAPKTSKTQTGSGVAEDPPADPKPPVAQTELPLKPYLEKLKLPSNRERAAAILAWSAESGGKRQLTSSEVLELWKKTAFKPPSNTGNLNRDLGLAVKEGWVDEAGTGKDKTFAIGGYGEGIVAGWAKES